MLAYNIVTDFLGEHDIIVKLLTVTRRLDNEINYFYILQASFYHSHYEATLLGEQVFKE